MDWEKYVNSHLLAISPYVPGKPVSEVQRELGLKTVHKLASNENILGPSPKAVEALKRAAGEVNYYPDGGCYYLTQALAERHGVKPSQVVIGAGTDEIIRLLCNALLNAGTGAVFGHPSFVMYTISSSVMGAEIRKAPLKDEYTIDLAGMKKLIDADTRLAFIANPNNPTGTIVTKAEADEFLRGLPEGCAAVFDEAYFEYVDSPDYPDAMEYVRAGLPVVSMRTFSKAYGLAGLRVGYGVLPEGLAAVLHRLRNPFNVNQPAQDAALAALGDTEYLAAARKFNADGRAYLCGEFKRLGLKFAESHTNFVLVDTGRDSNEVFKALLQKGVIVRPGAFLGFPTHIRVSVSNREGNEAFVGALEELLG